MIARFSVPLEDTFALDKRLTTAIGERMTVMRFWPGVKRGWNSIPSEGKAF